MRIDPVQPNFPEPPASAAKVSNPLAVAESELRIDSENLPVPAAAEVQTESQGSRPDTPNRGQIVVDQESRRAVYQIVDVSDEIVYQVPSEEVLRVSREIQSDLGNKEASRTLDVRS